MDRCYRDEEWLREKYHDEFMTTREVAEAAGLGSKRTIEKWMNRHGIERRSSSESIKVRGTAAGDDNPNAGGDQPWHDPDTLADYYWDRGWSAAAIGEKFNIHRETILYWMRKQNVPRRDSSYTLVRGEDHPLYKGGITPKNRRLRNSDEYKEWRESIFERDDYTCQKCGERGGSLNAHHIVPLSQDRSKALDMDNGVTLCVPCHDAEHPDVAVMGGD